MCPLAATILPYSGKHHLQTLSGPFSTNYRLLKSPYLSFLPLQAVSGLVIQRSTILLWPQYHERETVVPSVFVLIPVIPLTFCSNVTEPWKQHAVFFVSFFFFALSWQRSARWVMMNILCSSPVSVPLTPTLLHSLLFGFFTLIGRHNLQVVDTASTTLRYLVLETVGIYVFNCFRRKPAPRSPV